MKYFICLSLLMLLAEGCFAVDAGQVTHYSGASDPSAAAMVGSRHFVIGDDEHNSLRIYSLDGPSTPVFTFDMTGFLAAEPQHPEADIEGAANLGDRIYWITSHGRNKDGKIRPSRYRFFATEISAEPNALPKLLPVGKPCSTLIIDMLASPELSSLKLQSVTRLNDELSKKEQKLLAPKEKGINIEGLAAGPDGRSLWIALRNPLFADAGKQKGIIIPLLNPDQVIEEKKPARFGRPILLDLDKRGIRSIEYVESRGEYWIASGAIDTQANFSVFRYRPQDNKLTALKVDFPDNFTPECLFVNPQRNMLCFISDDGTLEKEVESPSDCMEGELLPNGNCPNKFIVDMDKRTFRTYLFTPNEP